MSSGFAGGLPDFSSATTSSSSANSNGIIQQQQKQPLLYHRPKLSGFLTENGGLGKRTLADFPNQQFQHQNPLLLLRQQQQQGTPSAFSMRSVKPRIYHNPSPISPLSPIDLLPEIGTAFMGHYPLRNFGSGSGVPSPTNLSYHHNRATVARKSKDEDTETDKKMMNRLQELEKQLLDDDNDDIVSVITGNEWSETIQNLIGTNEKTSPSPSPSPSPHVNTSSPTSSSSSCSYTVASPLPICPKQSLVEAAAAIADGKPESAAEIVTRLTQSSNPRGTPEQRLAHYMSLALKSKLTSVEGRNFSNEIRSIEHHESVQLLYQHSSCFKLGFLAANLAIIEATADVKSLHVVDFGMGDGAQYHNLLQSLSWRRSGKPTSIRITIVDVVESCGLERSRIAKEILSQLSDGIGVPFELKTLRLKVRDVSRESLCSSPDEVVAVNLAYILSKLPDESVSTENQRDELLRRVKGLQARIVTVVEEEMNCNTAPFQTRVAECCSFYGALLESMDSGMRREEPERILMEEGLGRKMGNSVACEGGDRLERCEVLGKWRARMGMAGFEIKEVSQNVVDSLSSRINSNSGGGGGTRVGCPLFVREANGGICFGWMGRIVTVTSAWR